MKGDFFLAEARDFINPRRPDQSSVRSTAKRLALDGDGERVNLKSASA